MSDEKQPEITAPRPQGEESALEPSQASLVQKLSGGRGRKYVRFVVAALSSIPWVGGLFGAAASFSAEKDQQATNELHRLWLEEHKEKVRELGVTFGDIFTRLDNFGDEVQERIESPQYLALVKKTFRSWDEADTQEKRQMLKKLITNAGAITLCPDDLIRLFIAWIDQYHEAHFTVIKEIYRNPGITRAQIWDRIHGQRVREDSADADLFRYLIRDLSTGGVIRQARETDMYGRFMKKDTRGQSREYPSRVMESAFEDTKPYVLTELGKQFVHLCNGRCGASTGWLATTLNHLKTRLCSTCQYVAMTPSLNKKLDRYFSIFDTTMELVRELIKEKRHPQEVLILLCARLDALASDSVQEGAPNSDAFSGFVTGYGGHRKLLESISVGDLYYELGYHRWMLDGMIPKAGRLCRFSRIDDPIIELLTKSGIPLIVKDAERLFDTLMSAL